MNNFSALDTRVSADKLEVNPHFQTAIYFEWQHILQIRMHFISILRRTVLLCLTYTFMLLVIFLNGTNCIINNEKNLTNGRNERKCLQRKYNDIHLYIYIYLYILYIYIDIYLYKKWFPFSSPSFLLFLKNLL